MNQKNQVYFKNIKNIISENIDSSQKSILIAVAWITDEYIINRLLSALKRGVNISILFYSDKVNNKDLFKKLYENGAIIKSTNKLMHNKFCIIDEKIVLNGSYNWTNNASNNHENIQIIVEDQSIINDYISEFQRIFNSANLIDDYFKNINEKLLEYIRNSEYPTKYPVFVKLNFYKFTIISYDLERIGNEYYYVFIKDKIKYEYLLEYLFNNKIRNLNYKFERFELPIFKNIYETKINNSIEKFNVRHIVFDEESECEMFEKKSYIKLAKNTYSKVQRKPIEEVYYDLFTYKEKIPNNIKSINDLKEFVKSFKSNLDCKPNCKISEELVLYKIYYNLPISFKTFNEPNYENENNNNFIFNYLDTSEFVAEDRNKGFSKINKNGDKIFDLGYHDSYGIMKYYNPKLYNDKIFSTRKNYSFFYEEFNFTDINKKTSKRRLYGLIDSKENIILPALFDYILYDTSEKIVFEILPIFFTNPNDYKYYYLSESAEINILNTQKERVLKFEYLIKDGKLNSINSKKNDLDFYLTDSNCIYANFYKTIIFITQNRKEIDEIKEYFFKTNKLNSKKNEMVRSIELKLAEIRMRNKNSQSNLNCYVATLLYRDINHPKVEFLRNFRDEHLSKSILGIKFINFYYKHSQKLVRYLEKKNELNSFFKFTLDTVIKFIKLVYYR